MGRDYTCNYLLKSGTICGRACYRSNGCCKHWKAKERLPCSVCGTPTSSKPGLCRNHFGTYYVKEYFKRIHEKAILFDQSLGGHKIV